MKIQDLLTKIYPNEVHPLTKAILTVGTMFIVAAISFVLVLGARNIPKLTNNLASLISMFRNYKETAPTEEKPLYEIKENPDELTIPAPTNSTSSTNNSTSSTNTENNKELGQTSTKKLELEPGPIKTNVYPVNGSNFSIIPGGIPDLMVQIVDTGIIDDAGNFIHSTSTDKNQQTGIVFDVWNLGTNISGSWRFLVELPILAGNFASEPQNSIAPGEKIKFTIGFRNLKDADTNVVRIIIDPQHELKETSTTNNIAETTVIRNY